MSSVKLDVLWSPVHEDKFIVWGPDITLYEVLPLKDIEKKTSFTQISSTRGAIVVASQSANGVRCVDISSIPDQQDPLLALGHSSGRVSLTSLKQTYDALGLVGREFVPQYSRMCNSVAWNPVETNILAVGLEKHRSDHSVLLWDVTRGNVPGDEAAEVSESDSETAHPIAEMGLSETTHHVAWTRFANRTLLASMNVKYIKIFDLRDLSKKEVAQTSSRHCYGVCADPFNEWRFASRGDDVAAVWDARALQAPLHTIHHARPLTAVHWCPTRRNMLLALQRDSNCVELHDIQQASADADCTNDTLSVGTPPSGAEAEVPTSGAGSAGAAGGVGGAGGAVLSRAVGARGAALAACAPHPARAGPLLCLTQAGGLVEYTICERVTVAWGARGGLVWGGGGGALRSLPDDFYSQLRDISYVMRKRAMTDYGLKSDLWQNADLADDESISNLWHFLALSKSLVEDGVVRGSGAVGVAGALRGAAGGYRSEAAAMLLPDAPARRVLLHRGPERSRALQLCAWGWGWDSALAGVERAEAEGTPCRAAALAAFHLRIRSALDVLHRAREPSLRLVALGAAGLGDERLWRDALGAATPALPDPYLRAMLHFLAATQPAAPAAPAPPPDYSAVLVSDPYLRAMLHFLAATQPAAPAAPAPPPDYSAVLVSDPYLRAMLHFLAATQPAAPAAPAPPPDYSAVLVSDPYLRAMLHFLAATQPAAPAAPAPPPDYSAVLVSDPYLRAMLHFLAATQPAAPAAPAPPPDYSAVLVSDPYLRAMLHFLAATQPAAPAAPAPPPDYSAVLVSDPYLRAMLHFLAATQPAAPAAPAPPPDYSAVLVSDPYLRAMLHFLAATQPAAPAAPAPPPDYSAVLVSDPYLRAMLHFLAATQPAAPAAPAPPPDYSAVLVSDPYLRAMLHFLAATQPAAPAAPAPPPDYSAVLNETEMRLEDRVAFACMYLPDKELQQYVRSVSDAMVAQGNLAGMLLTGASAEGAQLLQAWVERTGDVQTAALVAARCFPPAALAVPPAANWLDSYRSLLEGWQLWWARCVLDTWVQAAGGAGCAGAGAGVVVACTYCGKSVAAPPAPRRPPRLPPPHPNMKQMSVCPNCRKPLARCGVCGLHLGGAGAGGAGGAAGGAGGGAAFAGWFSWCVACRHGGHAQHLLQWFQEHTECPVSNCSCHCSTLDPPDRL